MISAFVPPTPSNLFCWGKAVTPPCSLCSGVGTLEHILSCFSKVLEEGRYHGQVLKTVAESISSAIARSRHQKPARQTIPFVEAGEKPRPHQRADMVLQSITARQVILELTVLWQDRMKEVRGSKPAILVVLTVCGNLLVIISISHFKQLHTPTNFLIVSLSTADLIVGTAGVPFLLVFMNPGLHIDTTLYYVVLMCFAYVTFLSIYNVALISLDRFYALSNPFQYSKKVTVKVISIVICSMWFISFMYNLAFVYFNVISTDELGIWANIDFIVYFLLPCCAIIILYTKIFVIARKHAISIRCTREQHISGTTKYRETFPREHSERKAAMKLGILVIVFVICFLPYFIISHLSTIVPATMVVHVTDASVTIVQLNSAINPIIYALLYPWFRRCAKLILTLRIFRRDSSLSNVLTKTGPQ
ncbi:trace amine-associated receptor 9-like [Alosa pseudoharengus]|uniref:trace amine-associated receptor 9-like n=1 Tax=Alosa pseudoharengus TaxID=34774 RepID=UPI003F88BEA5